MLTIDSRSGSNLRFFRAVDVGVFSVVLPGGHSSSLILRMILLLSESLSDSFRSMAGGYDGIGGRNAAMVSILFSVASLATSLSKS